MNSNDQVSILVKEMLSEFPGLIPLGPKLNAFRGWLPISGRKVFLNVQCHPVEGKCGTFKVDVQSSPQATIENMLERLEHETPLLVASLSAERTVEVNDNPVSANLRVIKVYLQSLTNAIESLTKSCPADTAVGCTVWQEECQASDYRRVLEQLEKIGLKHLKHVEKGEVTLALYGHEMTYSIKKRRLIASSLPEICSVFEHGEQVQAISWRPQRSVYSLTEAFRAFERSVSDLQPFYNSLKSLDTTVRIVDPHDLRQPYRRVMLEDCLVLQLAFMSPFQAGRPPMVELLGSPTAGKILRDCLRKVEWLRVWNPKMDVLQNLRTIFGEKLKLASKDNPEISEVDASCAICYAYLLGDKRPKVFCLNERCRKSYHEECFDTWALQWASEQLQRNAQESIPKPACCGPSTHKVAPCVYCEQSIATALYTA